MKTVLITGASSGIGEALAYECAKRGDALFVCGRDEGRLGAVVEKCLDLGAASVKEAVIDVRDAGAVRDWMESCDAVSPLDRVFANAGVSTGEESDGNVRNTFETNVMGTVNTVLPAIDLMRRRGKGGGIFVTSSLAGYGPLSGCPSYSASKNCIRTWALSLRGMLAPEGICVGAVCPGFVRSRITDRNGFKMPFFMEAGEAARKILAGADAGRGIIAFPWPMRFASWFLSILPWRLAGAISGLLPSKSHKRS